MRRPTRNEYGVQLDRNGYAPSIMPIDGFKCYKCQQWKPTERHEIFFGSGSKYNGSRDKSKQYGLWVPLCADCHRNAPDAVHNCAATRLRLEQDGQRHAMAYYHWTVSDFRRRFYKNYLDITED